MSLFNYSFLNPVEYFNNFVEFKFQTPQLNIWSTNFFFNFDTPFFQNNFNNFDFSLNMDKFSLSSTSASSVKPVQKTPSTSSPSSVKNIKWWLDKGYNPDKGKALLDYARPRATGFRGECVGYVRKAINNVYYNGNTHYKQFGKACNVGRDFLTSDRHFKKITGVELANINPKDIPEGVFIIYGPGYSKKHPTCGHGELSDGNGRGYSDGITNIKNAGHQKIQELWIPT